MLALVAVAACGRHKAPASAWEALALGTVADFRGLWFTDPQHGWIVGGNYQIPGGLVGRTRDGGKTWKFTSDVVGTPVGTGRLDVLAVRFFDPQRGLVAMQGGSIYATADGGEHWAPVHSGRGGADHVTGFAFVDAHTGWAIGLRGVLHTQDGGQRWSLMPGDGAGGRISGRAIQFLDDQNGWLAGMHGSLMYTVDGGVTWDTPAMPLAQGERPDFRDVFFVDDRNGWVVGDEGALLATRDGGDTWTRQDTGVPDARAAPRLERIQRGAKVDVIDTGDRTPGLTLSAVRFVDRERGWVVGYYAGLGRSLILRTQDGGTTWTVEADIAGEELRALFLQGNEGLWAIGARVREGPQAIYRRSLAAAPTGAN